RWEWERPNEVLWEPGRVRIPGIGQYSRFKDPNNDIYIEIFTPKTIDPNEAIKEAAAIAQAAATAKAEKEGSNSKATEKRAVTVDEEKLDVFADFRKDPVINKNYLGGFSKTLSEGAIQRPKYDVDQAEAKDGKDKVEENAEKSDAPPKLVPLQPLPQSIQDKVKKVIGEAESGLKGEKRSGERPRSAKK
ncbi:UNVERIFIED_CONTAM: hypothetical protein HDU68_011123, partial [Siphonaria sp. JEL0065]